jgi:signal transduction histidine kinase
MALLGRLDDTYGDADRTRYRLERALEISSLEAQHSIERQTALARSAEALLLAASESPESAALRAICDTGAVLGGWVIRFEPEPVVLAGIGEFDVDAIVSNAIRATAGSDPIQPVEHPGREHVCARILVHGSLAGTIGVAIDPGSGPVRSADHDLVATTGAMVAAHWTRMETQAELERLVASKDQFVASISHEIRTPLTGVVGFTRELQSHWHTFDEREIRDMIDVIAQQSDDIANMVEDLLVVARADIGRLRLHPEMIDLRHQVRLACGRSMPDFGEQVLFDGNGVAYGDPARVRQIIRNLVTNALRYGGPRVRVRIVRDVDSVLLEVRDDGPGVPPEAVERIFHAFESAHDAPTQPSSVGLGLWVARTLAVMMKGDLHHRREHGETVFTLVLPSEPGGHVRLAV